MATILFLMVASSNLARSTISLLNPEGYRRIKLIPQVLFFPKDENSLSCNENVIPQDGNNFSVT